MDVVAINWESKEILLGECKWGTDKIDRQIARELIEKKTSLTLLDLPQMGQSWKVHHVLFGGMALLMQQKLR